MNLRDYQQAAINLVCQGFMEFDRQLVVLPTGAGKTICFAALAKRFWEKRKEKTLILSHREELVQQAVDKIYKSTGLIAEIEKAESRASLNAPIVVGSVQTLRGDRLQRWPKDHFGLMVADEAHHALAASWQSTMSYFHDHAKVLGVTATPSRGDKKNLGQYFQNIAYEISLIDLIGRDYLSHIVIKAVPLRIDLNSVRVVSGEFEANDLGQAIEPYFEQIIGAIKSHASDRKTLVFLPLIQTSQRFAEMCNRHGITAKHVDGTSEDRKEILDSFARNEFQLLSNAMLLMEGYDDPSIDCVVMLRPTKSQPLYAQAIGRGTRLHENKRNFLILDFLWMHERHQLIRPANLIAQSQKDADEISAKVSQGGEEEQDLLEVQREVNSDRERTLMEEICRQQKRAARVFSIQELAIAFESAELADYEATMDWQDKPVTEKQAATLKKFQIDLESVRCKGHASAIIDKLFHRSKNKLATLGQVRWLTKLGHPNPTKATFEEAKAFLDEKWKKKTEVV